MFGNQIVNKKAAESSTNSELYIKCRKLSRRGKVEALHTEKKENKRKVKLVKRKTAKKIYAVDKYLALKLFGTECEKKKKK